MRDVASKSLFEYQTPDGSPLKLTVPRINPYLVDAPDILVRKRSKPISAGAPAISFGSMPNDDGQLILNDVERAALLAEVPGAAPFVRRFLTAHEVLHGINRWCLWLQGASPGDVRPLRPVVARIGRVRVYRAESKRDTTKALAAKPGLFGEIRQPDSRYILIPRHSSEWRSVIPMELCDPTDIVGDSCAWVGSHDLYDFGILQSAMHMAWVKQVCGRLEGRFRYSNRVVYNNFPWPTSPTAEAREAVRAAAKQVLEARSRHAGSSLADLYDVALMPSELVDAHRKLDRAVDRCYRVSVFESDAARLKYLFDLYAQWTGEQPITPAPVPLRRLPRTRPIRLKKSARGPIKERKRARPRRR